MAQQVDEEVVASRLWHDDLAGRFGRRSRASRRTYYFCNDSCLERFKADPESFVAAGAAGGASRQAGDSHAEYTCPMHPEVRQKGPGSCPICGMALEPVNVSLEEHPNEELVDMTRRFRWSLALTVPILLVMGYDFCGKPLHTPSTPQLLNLIALALATPGACGGWRSSRAVGLVVASPQSSAHAMGVVLPRLQRRGELAPDRFRTRFEWWRQAPNAGPPARVRAGTRRLPLGDPAVAVSSSRRATSARVRARARTARAHRTSGSSAPLSLAPNTARRIDAEEPITPCRSRMCI